MAKNEFDTVVSDDNIENFYDPESAEPWGPFVAKDIVLADTKLKRSSKASVLIRGSINGEAAGVWYKPGLRKLLKLGGVPVMIRATGETRDTGHPQPMKVFEIATRSKDAGKETPLRVAEDYRTMPSDLPNGIVSNKRFGGGTTTASDDDSYFGGNQ